MEKTWADVDDGYLISAWKCCAGVVSGDSDQDSAGFGTDDGFD